MVVILKPFSSAFTISYGLLNNTSDLSDLPLSIPADEYKFLKLAVQYLNRIKEAVNLGRSIMLMNLSPLTVQMLHDLRQPAGTPNAADWVILTFFLEDMYLENAKFKNRSFLDIKSDELLTILDFPFIKKYELPFGFDITPDYLKSIM